MKTVTIRMDEELAAQLEKEGDSLNRTIVDNLKRLGRIRLVSEKELKGVFTANEWKFFFDTLNGLMIDEALACNVGVLIAHCEDAEAFEGTATRWNVDINELKAKIATLKGANIEAIYDRVHRFWMKNGDLNTWAEFKE